MERHTFHHLDRDWEATISEGGGDRWPVRFRSAREDDPRTYEARLDAEELDPRDGDERELALRRGLESALVLDALSGHEAGLTAEEVARMTGMPADAAADRLEVLDSAQPVLDASGPRRYRMLDATG